MLRITAVGDDQHRVERGAMDTEERGNGIDRKNRLNEGMESARTGSRETHDVKFSVNLDGIKATEGANDHNLGEAASNLNSGGEDLDSPDFGGWSHDPGHHPLIRVVGTLLPIGVADASVASILSKLTKNLTSD
ncbi:hypothetical protein CRG98_024205 [Punica granatum]|uniref:Uncharacterized protein n=1 Tax=Punica granatum TaxID=22663 RepID=A0A2I0JGR2_PUNGR|nr:hypothetical protein CRG98_024205 [Punica granatum]